MSDEERDGIEEEEFTLTNTEVATKYNTAAGICNEVCALLIQKCVAGARIVDICQAGDQAIMAAVKTKYTKGKVDKGIAFPTCISVNNCAGHFSPLSGDTTVLADGDLVKIDLGAHIDGILAVLGHTVVVGRGIQGQPITGRQADAICAAYFASDIALKMLRPGNKASDITAAIEKCADVFHCKPVDGTVSCEIKRYVIEGNNFFLNKKNPESSAVPPPEDFEIKENMAFSVDVCISTGEGICKENGDIKTTVFKRQVDKNYSLKMAASRYLYSEINRQCPTFPFTLRAFDEKKARLGITEMLKHDLVAPYPVMYEQRGEFIAQFKFTVLVLPASISKITGNLPLPLVQSQYSIEDAGLKHILSLGLKRSTKKKGNKSKKKKGPSAAAAAATGGDAMEVE